MLSNETFRIQGFNFLKSKKPFHRLYQPDFYSFFFVNPAYHGVIEKINVPFMAQRVSTSIHISQ